MLPWNGFSNTPVQICPHPIRYLNSLVLTHCLTRQVSDHAIPLYTNEIHYYTYHCDLDTCYFTKFVMLFKEQNENKIAKMIGAFSYRSRKHSFSTTKAFFRGLYLGSLYTSPGWLSTRGSSVVAVKSKFCLHEPGLPPLTTIWGELMLTRVRSFVLRYVIWKTSQHYLFSSHLRSFHSCTGNFGGLLMLPAI